MEYQYKAFISYRHSKRDMKVAVEIQNRLESYRIPGSIRKAYGKKSVGRIFRDKDELPSTSDLNENIKEAIRSSEYLICICSPDYMESIWCRKELEFFLESHDKSHVLTVLSEGNPEEIVPELLRKETVTVRNEEGKEVSLEAALEPLSCDWRMDRHRARTEELPRLAAVLIGCRYAELRQKMLRRRRRLTAAAATAGALLIAYFIFSYLGIQRNYRQSLINQSQYLAASAQEALDGNDNLLAAQLSLAALPGEGKDRPIIPEALYTLSRAIGAYESKEILNFRSMASYEVSDGNLTEYAVSPDAAYLAMMSSGNGKILIWDLVEDVLVGQLDARELVGENYYIHMCGHGKDYFLIWNGLGHEAALIRFRDAAVIWHQSFEYNGSFMGMASAGDGKEAPIMLLAGEEVLIIDAKSGETVSRLGISDVSGGQATGYYKGTAGTNSGMLAICPEEECVCIAAGVEYEKYESGRDSTRLTGFVTYNYKNGKNIWTPFKKECWRLSGMSRDEDGRILLSCAVRKDDFVTITRWNDSYYSSSALYKKGKEHVVLLEEGSGNILWERDLSYLGAREFNPYVYLGLRLMAGNEDNPDKKVAVVATSNSVVLYDIDNGKTVREVVLPNQIISVDQWIEGDPLLRINSDNGIQYYFNYFGNDYRGTKFISDEVDDAAFWRGKDTASGDTQFLVRQGNVIRLVKGGTGDEDWKPFNCTSPEDTIVQAHVCGTTLIVRDESNNLYAYDLETGEDVWKKSLDKEASCSIRGLSADEKFLFIRTKEDEQNLIKVKVEDGSMRKVSVVNTEELTGAGQWHFDPYNGTVRGSCLFYRASNYNREKSFWFRYSLDDGSICHIKMPYYEDSSKTDKSVHAFAEDGSRGIIIYSGAAYLADFDKGTATQLEGSFPEPSKIAYQEEGGMFALWNSEDRIMRVYKANGQPAWTALDTSEYISRVWFYEGDLYAASEGKQLFRYRAKDGKSYGPLDLNFAITGSNAGCVDTGKDMVIIGSEDGNMLMVDLRNWAVAAEIRDALCYCGKTNQLISKANAVEDGVIGSCPCYSPEELIEKGEKYIGEHTLSDDQKQRYGID